MRQACQGVLDRFIPDIIQFSSHICQVPTIGLGSASLASFYFFILKDFFFGPTTSLFLFGEMDDERRVLVR
jgi:hypothetical protein